MEKEKIIYGYCPEIAKGGAFNIARLVEASARVIRRSDEDQHVEVGRVTGLRQGFVHRDNYSLKTTGGKVPLQFCRRDKGSRVILCLPGDYFFGREIMDIE
jgi:hypothetical protein